MDNEVLISIIIPFYNVANYIRECIDSLSRQTFKKFEVIFVDDCGQDNSETIVKEHINEIECVSAKIVKRNQNGGLSAARNTGIHNSSGQYLLFLDSDDYLSDNAVELFYKEIVEAKPDVVIGSYYRFPSGKEGKNRVQSRDLIGNEIKSAYYNNKILVTVWNKLVRRDFLVDNNLYNEEGIIHEDLLWSFLTFSSARRIAFIDNITYYYRERDNSIMTATFGEKNINSLIRINNMIHTYSSTKHDLQAAAYAEKKLLEFTLKIFAKGNLNNRDFSAILRRMDRRMVNSSAAWINLLIGKSPWIIKRIILAVLLNTKFSYCKK